jgi:hypothetical protein
MFNHESLENLIPVTQAVVWFFFKLMAKKYKRVKGRKPMDDIECTCLTVRKDYVLCVVCGILLFTFTVIGRENWKLRAVDANMFEGILAYSSASEKDTVSCQQLSLAFFRSLNNSCLFCFVFS